MRSTHWLGICAGAALGALVASSCEDDSSNGGAGDFCGALTGYVSPCGEPSPCENAVIRDCGALQSVLYSDFGAQTTDCMSSLGDPMACMRDAVALTPSRAAFEKFANTLCLECGSGAGACEDDVLAGTGDSDLARAGRLARALGSEPLQDLADACATGEGCAAGFDACAIKILGRSVPSETAQCLADAVSDAFSEACDVADTGSAMDSDEGEGEGEGTSDTGSNDTDDTDDSGETGCTAEGCPCMFTEDCGADLICVDNVCVAALQCDDDPTEPNDNETDAYFLGQIGDGDGEGSTIISELSGPDDTDWFSFDGLDNFGGIVNPYAQLNVQALALCMYAECHEGLGATSVTCPDGTTQQPSPAGRPGCCASNTTGFELAPSCGSTGFDDDSAYIYISVSGSEPGVCQEFTLSYHF